MALETVMYPQDMSSINSNYACKNFYPLELDHEHNWAYHDNDHHNMVLQEDHDNITIVGDINSSPDHPASTVDLPMKRQSTTTACRTSTTGRRKRRRTKSAKNREEMENQRMTHIAVERNRRKQMNDYLAVLRSLMPPSYVQRGDQASIIGGAINFVKELEQHLQFMKVHNKTTTQQPPDSYSSPNISPLAELFTFPQYSTCATHDHHHQNRESTSAQMNQYWAVADIEVNMVESHANLKILSKKQPKQLLKMVLGFQTLRLTVLHLNVTTVDHMVLYSLSLKVEEGCQLNTVDEIAAAVNQMLHIIEEEAALIS